ncbi:M20/M25/M40 family metallo-hydrolase [Clostridium sporogenes]|uniref:M28 family peptidase n=1 Tax=Clostridium sporogenes TaxID=1509 RepID=UPI0013D101D3|nr:M28 family peptidase [Clostridium sporogenes]NFV14388.1 M20/M25/M40 family metallo-hydrolase [Clostridium sporogenes]
MFKKIFKKKYLKMFIIIFLLLMFSCFYKFYKSSTFNGKDSHANNTKKINLSNDKIMMDTINSICTTNREIGSNGEKKACEILRKQIQSYGYETQIQKVPYQYYDKDQEITGETQNLIAIKKSTLKHNKGTIIVSAHYDCAENSIGANDNASGVAAAMEVARLLNKSSGDYELQFIFFGGEEFASTGSRYYLSQLSDNDKKNIKADINIDSIAQKNHTNPCIFTVDGKENFATELLKNNSKNKGIIAKKMYREISDYVVFYEYGIPSLCIGQSYDKNLSINGPQDKISIIDKTKLKLVVDMLLKALSN